MDDIDFYDLNLNDKATYITERGCYVDSIIFYHLRVDLYSVEDVFAEVYYNKRTNAVERVQFADDLDLKKHLSKIKININQLLSSWMIFSLDNFLVFAEL
jgi:hypothetical protein